MEVIVELAPIYDTRKLVERARRVSIYADALSLPEAPLGLALAPSSITALVLRLSGVDAEVIPHLKVTDYAPRLLLSVVRSLESMGVSRALLVRGDVSAGELVCIESAEEALSMLHEYSSRLSTPNSMGRISYGALISLRKPMEDIMERISTGFSFYYVLRSQEYLARLRRLAREAHRRRKKLYAYLIVGSKHSIEKLRLLLSGQPLVELTSLESLLRSLEGLVEGVVFSNPISTKELIESLRIARKIA